MKKKKKVRQTFMKKKIYCTDQGLLSTVNLKTNTLRHQDCYCCYIKRHYTGVAVPWNPNRGGAGGLGIQTKLDKICLYRGLLKGGLGICYQIRALKIWIPWCLGIQRSGVTVSELVQIKLAWMANQ